MMTPYGLADDPFARDRLVLVSDRSGDRMLLNELRARYPEWAVATCDSYLSGIAELARRPAHAVLAVVDTELAQLDNAVAGLRSAAGPEAKFVLCCTPDTEPVARDVVANGADDYIILPLVEDELDRALGLSLRKAAVSPRLTDPPAATMDELVALSGVLSALGGDPRALLDNIASLVVTALRASGVALVADGTVVSRGGAVADPVLSAPLRRGDEVIGQINLAERADGAYSPGDVEKLTHYATMFGHVLTEASTQRRWARLAATDECSGLPNRRHITTRLGEILARAADEKFPVTLLLFDLDDFKSYNDAYGHEAGDEIIRVTGELFRKHCREQDIVARYGGDEFAVLFWDPQGPRVAGSKHPDGVLAVLDRFTEALRSQEFPLLGPSGTGRLTISGGLATYPWDAATHADLFRRADEALLAAKRAGKNRIYLIGEAGLPT